MKFVDYVTITVRSGKGGAGAVTFRREKYEPRGGPSGGDGGDGGSVILEADPNLYTLLDLRYNRHHFAESGEPGGKNNQKGKSGEDIVLGVPPGTVVTDSNTDEVIGELREEGDRLVVAQGGQGGKGNTFFKSSTNRAPRQAQPGTPGEEREITLQLKLLADVGLVGKPNAGKSTLVSALSAAKPKIADYPFTTMEPALGVVYLDDYKSFVMADIPGIIEGAHEGKGLGHQFLQHIERNAVLLLVIPVTDKDLQGTYETLLNELEAYDATLLDKPRIICLTKIDVLPEAEQSILMDTVRGYFPENERVIPVSAVARKNLNELTGRLWEAVRDNRKAQEQLAG